MSKFRVIVALLIGIIFVLSAVIPVYAIDLGNPTTIRFYGANTPGTVRAKAFYNVDETGDMLFLAESYVYFAGGDPTEYTAQQAFSFDLLDTDRTTVLLSTPITGYGCKIISIYQTAAQVTAMGLVSGTQYYLRITMNPAVMTAVPTTPTENTNFVIATLDAQQWINQATGKGTSNDSLVSYIVRDILGGGSLASDLEANDAVTTYITTVQGINYLTTTGGNIFLLGCPNLAQFVPMAFQTNTSVNTSTDPSSTNGLETTGDININDRLGNQLGNAFTNLGYFLGGSTIKQWMAGLLGLFIIMFVICFAIAKVTGHPVVGIALGSMTLVVGGFLGLMPMAMAFAITALIFILAVWFFFSRGYV